jgi:Transmembrane protein 18
MSSFFEIVDWREPFVVITISIHFMTFLAILLFPLSRNFLLVILGICGFCLESLNGFFNRNYILFTTVNYFDANGVSLSANPHNIEAYSLKDLYKPPHKLSD